MWNAKPAEPAEPWFFCVLCALCVLLVVFARAQAPATTRLAVLQAEDRRAPTPRDLAVIRSGAHSPDAQTMRVAIRALGRLERPSLIPDIAPALRNAFPEIRSEAANAIGQAAQGWKRDSPPAASAVDAVVNTLAARLKVEADHDVRAALCETVGRLPYTTAAQVEAAERTLLDMDARSESVTDRLGVAKGFEALVRIQRRLRAPGDEALARLRRLARPGAADASTADRDVHVVLLAIDQLGACGPAPDAVDALERAVNDLSDVSSARGWHRAAHAIVALAAAEPVRGARAMPQFIGSRIWQLRMYAARAAAELNDRAALDGLAKDDDDNVREAAVEGLRKVAGHDADAIYVSGLERTGYQIVRAAAAALDGTPHPELAVPALNAAWQPLIAAGPDHAHDAQGAIAKALDGLATDPSGRAGSP